MGKKNWKEIKTASEGKLDSLQELLAGEFPKALGEIFTTQGKGLFPSPKDIDFDCSCPDWASMCKHVAATLYGIGARLDQDPGLFFKLRKVKMKDLVTEAVEEKTRKLLKKARKKTSRVIDDSDLADVFGIDMESPVKPKKRKKLTGKKAGGAKKPPKPTPKKVKVLTGKAGKKVTQKKTSPRTKKPKTPFETVVEIVRRSRKGVTVAVIREKTGFGETQIRNAIYRARQQGKIKNKERGVYMSA